MRQTADRTPTLIGTILDACAIIRDGRSHTSVALHALSELGELAIEVKIATGCGGRLTAGEDGVAGEAIDLILCVVDFMKCLDGSTSDHRFIGALNARAAEGGGSFVAFALEGSSDDEPVDLGDRAHLVMSIAGHVGRMCEVDSAPFTDEINDAFVPAARAIQDCLMLIRIEIGRVTEEDLIGMASKKLDKWIAGTLPRDTASKIMMEAN